MASNAEIREKPPQVYMYVRGAKEGGPGSPAPGLIAQKLSCRAPPGVCLLQKGLAQIQVPYIYMLALYILLQLLCVYVNQPSHLAQEERKRKTKQHTQTHRGATKKRNPT